MIYNWVDQSFPYFADLLKHFQRSSHSSKLCPFVIDALPPDLYQNIEQLGKKVIVTNNWIKPGLISEQRVETLWPFWYGIYAGKPICQEAKITKNFNCLINRMDPTRQSWLYLLVRQKLFDHGYVSFNMDISRHIALNKWPPDTSPHQVFDWQFLNYCDIFQDEHQFIKTHVPYRNFDSTWSLDQLIMSTGFSIILETYHDNNDVITFSEKIFRCLKLPRPWVMHAHKGSVQHLRDMGYDVLDDVVDHSYDQIDFTIDRQSAILDQCNKLMNIDISAILKRLCEAANHNINLLDHYSKKWKTDLSKSLHKAEYKYDHA